MGWRTGRGRGLQWSTKLPIDDCRLTIERIRKSKFAARSRGNRAFTSFEFPTSSFEFRVFNFEFRFSIFDFRGEVAPLAHERCGDPGDPRPYTGGLQKPPPRRRQV